MAGVSRETMFDFEAERNGRQGAVRGQRQRHRDVTVLAPLQDGFWWLI